MVLHATFSMRKIPQLNSDNKDSSILVPDQARWVHFMKHALKIAAYNTTKPFGTILVRADTDEVLAEGVNRTGEDPILHAEIDAIHNCARFVPNVPWEKLELYTTAEPCAMCQCAISFARIPFIFFGTSGTWLKNHRWRQIDIPSSEIILRTSWSKAVIVGGILEAECNALFECARPIAIAHK